MTIPVGYQLQQPEEMQADLGGDGGSTFARNVAAKVENAIKQKATVEEIRNILRYD